MVPTGTVTCFSPLSYRGSLLHRQLTVTGERRFSPLSYRGSLLHRWAKQRDYLRFSPLSYRGSLLPLSTQVDDYESFSPLSFRGILYSYLIIVIKTTNVKDIINIFKVCTRMQSFYS